MKKGRESPNCHSSLASRHQQTTSIQLIIYRASLEITFQSGQSAAVCWFVWTIQRGERGGERWRERKGPKTFSPSCSSSSPLSPFSSFLPSAARSAHWSSSSSSAALTPREASLEALPTDREQGRMVARRGGGSVGGWNGGFEEDMCLSICLSACLGALFSFNKSCLRMPRLP